MSKELLVKAIDELSEYVLNNHEAYAIVRGYNQTPEEHDYFCFGELYWKVVKQAVACNLADDVPKAETHSTEQWSPSEYNDEAVVGILVLCDRESFLIDLSKLRAQATDTDQADNGNSALLAMLGDNGAQLLKIARSGETVEKRMSDLLLLRPEWIEKPASWWAKVLNRSESAVKHKDNQSWKAIKLKREENKAVYFGKPTGEHS